MVNICIVVCNFFTAKRYWSRCLSRWENLDRLQYRFQPIKFMNMLVCETQPYNKYVLLNEFEGHTGSYGPSFFLSIYKGKNEDP